MAKIPFDIKYRPQIESGEYKVETKDGRPARIICWDRDGEYPILYLVRECDGEICFSCTNSGNSYINQERPRDLLLITPEPRAKESEEQPEVDLETEVEEWWQNWASPPRNEYAVFNKEEFINLARHFYGLRNRALEEAARHVYESWMGGTMDDVRRDMVELGKVLNARKEAEK